MKNVTVIGASNIDIMGIPDDKYIKNDSTIGKVVTSIGGVGFNIARNLAKLDLCVTFISAINNDYYGKMILDEAKSYNINYINANKNATYDTGKYLAILDSNNDMISAINDMNINETINADFLKNINIDDEVIVVDANINKETIEYIANKYKNKSKLFLEPVSTKKALRAKDVIDKFDAIKPNFLEASELVNMDNLDDIVKKLKLIGVKKAFITLDKDGVFAFDEEKKIKLSSLISADQIKNATGAGDAFSAGVIYGLLNNYDIKKSSLFALACAKIALMSKNSVSENMSIENINKILNEA